MNLKNRTLTVAALCSLAACGAETLTPPYAPLAAVPPFQAPASDDGGDSGELPPPPADTAACQFLETLPSENRAIQAELTQLSPTFQMVEGLTLEPGNRGNSATVMGRHVPAYLPQLMYVLSAEYAAGARKSIDPITIAEFMTAVREKYAKGELSWLEKTFVEFKYKRKDWAWLTGKRNDAQVSAVEARLPGVFTGKPGDLSKSALMGEFYTSTDTTPENLASNFGTLAPLARRYALFTGEGWEGVSADFRAGLAVLGTVSNRADIGLGERVCRFVVKHRLFGQLFALKGLTGAPRLKRGLLLPLATEDVATYPTVDLLGAFDRPLNGTVVGEQASMDVPTLAPPRLGGWNSADYLEFVGLMAKIQATRSPDLWLASGEAPRGQLRLDAAYLKLSLGLMVIGTKQMSAELLVRGDRLGLANNDTEDNFAKLGKLALNNVEAIEGLVEATAFDLELYGPEQIEALAVGETSLLGQMNTLMLGVGLEGLARYQEGRRSTELTATLRRIGHRIQLRALTELE